MKTSHIKTKIFIVPIKHYEIMPTQKNLYHSFILADIMADLGGVYHLDVPTNFSSYRLQTIEFIANSGNWLLVIKM